MTAGATTPADAAPKTKVRFSAAAYQVAENAGAATITMVRTRNLTSPATVHYFTAAVTAAPGADYTETSGSHTFPAAERGVKSQEATFEVPVADDFSRLHVGRLLRDRRRHRRGWR